MLDKRGHFASPLSHFSGAHAQSAPPTKQRLQERSGPPNKQDVLSTPFLSLPWNHPVALYKNFEILAASTYVLGMFFLLRKQLSPLRLLGLILASCLGVLPVARAVSYLASSEQGQSHYGALLAQMLGLFLYLKILRFSPQLQARAWNAFALLSGLVYALLRLGCYFRGCCWGRICPYPWATYYRHEDVVTPWMGLPLHPVQLYSSFHGFVVTFLLFLFLRRQGGLSVSTPSLYRGLGFFLLLLAGGRLITDSFRADAAYFRQAWGPFFPNTVLSITLAVLGLFLLCWRSHVFKRSFRTF